ncbi:hypothetical protein [Dyadobacter bucti]|jgi:hypothetical protein|uniref:hypothetical protein n=1 Tax=Dyadobacter bucti TaxID=2572203 RepID=UPI003F6F0C7C
MDLEDYDFLQFTRCAQEQNLEYMVDFSELFKRSRKFENPHGSVIHFLHLNDLRELKILARRPQDIRDVIMIDDLIQVSKDQRNLDDLENGGS